MIVFNRCKVILIIFQCFLLSCMVQGQIFSVDVIHKPDRMSDSSIYDIIKIDNDKYLMSGKNGYMQVIDRENNLHKIQHTGISSNLLKATRCDSNKIIIGGTDGTIVTLDNNLNITKTIQLPHFSYACFYDVLSLNDSTILLAGGHNKIAEAKKRLPRGFIIETQDYGETWNYIYRNPVRMIWDIEKDADNNILASTYSPFNTKIINLGNNFKNTLMKCKTLVHSISINYNDSSFIFAGAQKHEYRKTASLFKLQNKKIVIKEELNSVGMFWDIIQINDFYYAAGFGGMIYRIDQQGNIDSFDTQMHESLYELIEIDSGSFFVVGSNQTILKVNILSQTTAISTSIVD